jgi:predicted nucleic acid-binding protein
VSESPQGLVLDASAVLQLFLPEEYSETVERLLLHREDPGSASVFVPDLLFVEVANALRKRTLRREIARDEVAADLADLVALGLTGVPTEELFEEAFVLALAHSISAYDACYVSLADRLGLPLVTADERLAAAVGAQHQVLSLPQVSLGPET